ncbi:MAG: radical SAM/SPASM domain-containing protein [Phycisphaerae bacterium]
MTDPIPTRKQDSFVFEVTQRCNHDCPHCYNCWKNPVDYPRGELSTPETLAMLDKLLDETDATLVSLSGGEPFLREDIFEIVDHLDARGVGVNMICNGSLVTEEAIERLAGKIGVWELPLLSVERAMHDELSGRVGAFDDVTMAIADLKLAGELVVCVFVATRRNLPRWQQTAELAIALGTDGIMFNRFNPGGEGARHVEELQPTPQELRDAMAIADRMSAEYEIGISCSIAMPPCLFDHEAYENLSFGFCAAGTERAYYTLDPLGNIRPCNHSPTILGNIREASFAEIAESAAMRQFMAAVPEICGGCRLEKTCQGGCKAAAEACFGRPDVADPFLRANADRLKKLS